MLTVLVIIFISQKNTYPRKCYRDEKVIIIDRTYLSFLFKLERSHSNVIFICLTRWLLLSYSTLVEISCINNK